MSAAGVALVLIYDAFARRDGAAIFARLSDDREFHPTPLLPWGDYRGHDGAREFFTRPRETIDSVVTVERLIAAGDHVVAVGRTRGRVLATGAAFDVAIARVWTVGDARIARFEAVHRHPGHARGPGTPLTGSQGSAGGRPDRSRVQGR